MSRVFLDHNATTMPSIEVLEAIKAFEDWGNPSSIHSSGRRAKASVLRTRRAIAREFDCAPGEITFTSGGSEANNTVLKGLLSKLKERGQDTIVSSQVEHPAVFKTLDEIKKQGFNVIRVPVTLIHGFDYDFLDEALKENSVGLVSVMRANNETGEIFDLRRIRSLIDSNEQSAKIYFHSDMVQTLGKISVDLTQVDFASFSAHKFYSLHGMGFLYHRKGVGFTPLIHGGGQERGRRAGTENLLAISVFEKQIEKLPKLSEVTSRISELRDYMEKKLDSEVTGIRFLAQERKRVPNTSLMLIEGVHGETMLINLDIAGFEVSTGAACSSGNPEPSPVLIAMGLSPQEASKSLRVSLGWQTTQDEIDRFVETLIKVVAKLRGL